MSFATVTKSGMNTGNPTTATGTQNKNNQPPAKSKLTPEQENTLNNLEKYLVTPATYFTGLSSAASFILTHVLKNQNELVDKISTWSNKAAVYATAIFSTINRFWNRDSFGTVAFGIDLITTAIANGEDLYQWKGFGSGLDHSPLILGEVHSNPKIGVEKDEFLAYKDFGDSAKKMLLAVKVIVGDIVDEFKTKNPLEAFMSCFVKGERNAEKNLLVSGAGIIGGAFLGTILGFKKLGATIRDGFGIYADLAYIAKGLSKVSGEAPKSHKPFYTWSGIEYAIGSVLDLIYRWTGLENLNHVALAIDRLGARHGALGVVQESREANKKKEQQPASIPHIALAPAGS